jgi:hypothetical protein
MVVGPKEEDQVAALWHAAPTRSGDRSVAFGIALIIAWWAVTLLRATLLPRLYHVSAWTELRSSIEAEHRDLASREVELAEEILNQLARHFGVGAFVQ